jgi:Holliday junction resolvase
MNFSASLRPVLFLSLVGLAATSCKKCKNEDPRARIANNGTQVASVQVKTSGGNTVNINNVAAGATSDYANYAAGQTTFTLKVNNVDYAKTIDARQCHEYTIAIDRNNVIAVTDTDRND